MQTEPAEGFQRWLPRLAALVTLLPVPCFFVAGVLRDRGPTWRAEYRATAESKTAVSRVERALSHEWGKHAEASPIGLAEGGFSAAWQTCLHVQSAVDVPLQLVSSGESSLRIDEKEVLRNESSRQRVAAGRVMRFEPGVHHLRVEFVSSSRPSVALNASFDGKAPRAIIHEHVPEGIRFSLPVTSGLPCSE